MNRAFRTILLAIATLLVVAASASAAGGYANCPKAGDAIIVDVSGATCEEARAVATALAGVPAGNAEAALLAVGWRPLRAIATGFQRSYDLVATRGLGALLIRRPGDAPDLDGWMAGRELLFARERLVPGARPPRGASVYTSAFLIRLRTHPGGLSAGHCAGLTRKRTTRRRNAALRRPPQTGIILGRVQRNLERRKRRLDALVLPVPSGPGRPAAPVIDRGVLNPPWFVIGSARPLLGRRVCFAGRTSGADRCGRIVRSYPGTRLPCTTITAREGDSGGPVYTAPGADGTVRAVGITTLVFGLLQSMCFTPLEPVLDALNATLVTSPRG
ncbi:MAG: S1 family peptidase [Actinobacteria bacterium]|nr:S1 family peptidase [Actinomycetota bacterium]